jgi:tetratricopeptide (TPR) repeat protein
MNKTLRQYSLLVLLLGVTLVIYSQGISGSFYFDDFRPLGNLANVNNFDSAWLYVFSEISGPLGRPISMATFLFNIDDWPNGNRSFLLFNSVLHVFNGLLIFGLSYYIARLYRGAQASNYYLALITCAFWLLLPIHVSTSLIAVQRMAGLSAFFVLSGSLLYLYSLYTQNTDIENGLPIKNKAVFLQFIAILLFTVLAMLSKENGILLPAFIFVLEITLLYRVTNIAHGRKVRIAGSALCLITVLACLAYLAIMRGNDLPGRDFTLVERLLTQPQVLIEYVQLAFFPNINAFTPFHDTYTPITSLFSTYQAMLSMLAICTSFLLAIFMRNKWPLYSFAVLWFLTAHLLESSVISLELYYEHRNYIALFGPCLALVMALFNIPSRYKNLSIGLIAIYSLMLLVTLCLTTRLWGEQILAAETWFVQKPGSIRASEHLAYLYMKQGKLQQAELVFTKQTQLCPTCITSHAQAMVTSCVLGNIEKSQRHYQSILSLIAVTSQSTGLAKTLSKTYQAIKSKRCTALTFEQLGNLNTALLSLPKSPFNKKLGLIQNLYSLALLNRDKDEAISLLYLAWQEKKDMNIASELIRLLLSDNQTVKAHDFLTNKVCKTMPSNIMLVNNKKKQCNSLTELVSAKGEISH